LQNIVEYLQQGDEQVALVERINAYRNEYGV